MEKELKPEKVGPKNIEKREKEPQIRILVLEDQFTKEAVEGLSSSLGPIGKVLIVKSLKELEEVPLNFSPAVVILDLEVPKETGGEPEENLVEEVASKIVEEKFPAAIKIYYTSFYHRKVWGGVGESPKKARSMMDFLRDLYKDKPELIHKIEEMQLGEKSRPESWRRILEVFPLISSRPRDIVQFITTLPWPEEMRKEMLEILKGANPELARSVLFRLKTEK